MKSARSGSLARDILSRESLSSIPKHMKSTSSRFSFDMIGAAKQEKLLEERHRQRQLEIGTDELDIGYGQRDSRFDDIDDFDYDAMMDDDGLEEAIPGVNADYDEEPIPGMEDEFYEEAIPGVNIDYEDGVDDDYIDDPDNDQENFAGFVFSRSPRSGMPTPHSSGLTATPRDAEGNAIGFAFSKDSPLSQMPSPQDPLAGAPDEVSGLEMQNLAVSDEKERTDKDENKGKPPGEPSAQPRTNEKDDLYFDDGLIGMGGDEFAEEFVDELDFSAGGEPFNEALFDLDDTDQYGRPIPGAFKAAKEAYAARHVEQNKRESDGTSGQFDQSAMSVSTTRTSVSAPGPQHHVSKVPSEEISPQNYANISQAQAQAQALSESEDDPMSAYQAALAAAAHRAAADGKFRRESPPQSPVLPATEDRAEPASPDAYPPDEPTTFDFDDYENDDMDFDMDDDDIIAEANADALANDSEGWYGHEFGFYSAPATQHDLPFEYANGGYFGPSGPNANGRAVSREPNLTPITERSEYSNRNSIMSLAVPPIGSASSLQSPGLAQLAMMQDGDDNMTLSALLRLRTKAWGGSQASLGSSRDGSPRSERGEGASSPQQLGVLHARKGSSFSVLSQEAHSLPTSPTTGPGANGALYGFAAGSQSACASPVEERNPVRGHRHKGSAGSISYIQEESGDGRWVVEKRRMDERGEVEVEREVLAAGRI